MSDTSCSGLGVRECGRRGGCRGVSCALCGGGVWGGGIRFTVSGSKGGATLGATQRWPVTQFECVLSSFSTTKSISVKNPSKVDSLWGN